MEQYFIADTRKKALMATSLNFRKDKHVIYILFLRFDPKTINIKKNLKPVIKFNSC